HSNALAEGECIRWSFAPEYADNLLPALCCLPVTEILNRRMICIILRGSDMRYKPEHKTQTRDRIVRNAARKLRAEGLSGAGVASVMKASGLTVGGFYKHFRSKDELLAEAIAQGFSELSDKVSSVQNVPPEDRWKEV